MDMCKKLSVPVSIISTVFIIFMISGIEDTYPVENKKKADEKIESRIIIAHEEIFGKLERPQVVFDHGRHSEAFKKEGCKTCHPDKDDGGLDFEHTFKMISEDETSVMNSYHKKCINCHAERKAEEKKAGPVTCGDCHVKESGSLIIKLPAFEFDFFHHDKHGKKLDDDCSHCHHVYDDTDEELVYEEGNELSCYYCHDDKKKRGPSLEIETGLTLEKGLTIRKISHHRCLNCHLERIKQDLEAGPLECSKCHSGKYRTVDELSDIVRPDLEQPEKPIINIENAKMKSVLFDHKFHEVNIKKCRSCHHETLNACKECHGLVSKSEGRGVNLSGAYHDSLSVESCTGCHRIKQAERDCAGCHHHLPEMDQQAGGLGKETCRTCHSGKTENQAREKHISTAELNTREFPKEVKIKILEKDYDPVTLPHIKMIKKLVKISNESKMAAYFHKDLQTICQGCHHYRHLEAEDKKNSPPFCRNCHTISFDTQNLNRPRLQASYHRRCIGCHENMGLKPMGCKDCHKEKALIKENVFLKIEKIKTVKSDRRP